MYRSHVIVLLIQIFIIIFSNGQRIGEACTEGKGICKILTDCPVVADNFLYLYTMQNIIFCDSGNSVVCCPKPAVKKSRPPITVDSRSEIFLRECLAYRNAVYGKCEPQALIVGGSRAEPREFPHNALLGVKNDAENSLQWLCGGTLISRKFVVSAAHCFYDNDTPNYVRLGELDYNSNADDAQTQDFHIKNFIKYPDFKPGEKYHDIILIELDREATFTRYVVPACLPLTNGTEFQQFIATGWGSVKLGDPNSSHLLKVRLDRFDDKDCKEWVEPNEYDLEKGVNERTQICAGSHTDNRDTCTGDSGGPLFVEHPDYPCMYLLVGVTSFGRACGIRGSPGVYTRVNLYVDWIEKGVWNSGAKI